MRSEAARLPKAQGYDSPRVRLYEAFRRRQELHIPARWRLETRSPDVTLRYIFLLNWVCLVQVRLTRRIRVHAARFRRGASHPLANRPDNRGLPNKKTRAKRFPRWEQLIPMKRLQQGSLSYAGAARKWRFRGSWLLSPVVSVLQFR